MNAAVDTATATQQTVGKTTTMNALKQASADNVPTVDVGFTSLQSFELILRVARMFADSSIVPERFQRNLANCAIALEMAHRLGASPLMVMQNLYVVYGTPAWAAKFLIACFNQCGRYTSIKYAFEGTRGKDDWGCRAWATEKSTGERVEGPLINIKLAKDEGWYDRKSKDGKPGSKWPTMPEQMLRYRSASWMINTVAPEISMGLKTTDEIDDIGAFEAKRDSSGMYAVDLDTLRNANNNSVQTGESEQKSPPDPKEWAKKLGACPDAELVDTFKACAEAFGEDGVPNECDAVYQNRREAIAENAGKQLEL